MPHRENLSHERLISRRQLMFSNIRFRSPVAPTAATLYVSNLDPAIFAGEFGRRQRDHLIRLGEHFRVNAPRSRAGHSARLDQFAYALVVFALVIGFDGFGNDLIERLLQMQVLAFDVL